jgi:ABC-type sugar transport system ATPase subunit
MAGLIVKEISKSFGDAKVLDRVSLELAEGELLVLLGSSGCGKSTLLRIIAGLEETDSGEVWIGGKRVDQLRPKDRNVALVFQNYSLYPHMSVEKNLGFPLKVAGTPRQEIAERVKEIAAMIGLGDRLKDRPAQLSGGQRQRVALGRAIIRKPSIFLLDEPLSNLDADLRARMRQEIVKLQREVGVAMVHVTHDQTEALTMADRVAMLHHGRVEQVGSPKELYESPATVHVARFVGQPKINMIEATLENGRMMPLGIGVEELDAGIADRIRTLGKVRLGIRPEAIEISPNGVLSGEVTACEYMGDHFVIELKYRDLSLTVTTVASPETAVGRTVRFSVSGKRVLVFDASTGSRIGLESVV